MTEEEKVGRKEAAGKRLIVHFGAGTSLLGYVSEISKDEFHVVYDPAKSKIVSDFYARRKKRILGRTLILRRAQESGLKEGVAHEVHIHNVLNDVGVGAGARESLLREAARILRRDGTIYVGNTFMVECYSKEKLVREAARSGLNTEILLENTSDAAGGAQRESFRRITHNSAVLFEKGAYLAKLTKK